MTRLCSLLTIFVICSFHLIFPTSANAILVSNAWELQDAVAAANWRGGDKLILLADGTYTLDDMLWVETDGVTVRSQSGARSRVVIRGQGMAGWVTHVFNLAGSHFTVQDVTLRDVAHHAVQLQPGVDGVVIRNVHIMDTGTQMIKVAYNPDNMGLTADNGLVENCRLEYTAGIGPRNYIGGIDAHNSHNWIVRNNTLVGIRSPDYWAAEPAIHFWSQSANTLVEGNKVINCDRGIGFGMADQGHSGGIIRNNMVYHDASEGAADVGIMLESASGAKVYNNTIYMRQSHPWAIEYRFSGTRGGIIRNNLSNKGITSRDGGSATLSHNVTSASASWFVQPAAGDLHLSGPIADVVDQGLAIDGLTRDFDGDWRPSGSAVDIGADEIAGGIPDGGNADGGNPDGGGQPPQTPGNDPAPNDPQTPQDPVVPAGPDGPPGPAVLVSPSGSITGSSPTFTWQALSGASGYYIYLEGPGGFTFEQNYTAGALTSGNTCSLTLSTPLAQGTYIWLVHGYNAAGYGPWVQPLSFTISTRGSGGGQTPQTPSNPASADGPPGPAVLLSPSGTVTANPPTFTWQSLSGASGYYIYLEGPGGFKFEQNYTAGALTSGDTCALTLSTPLAQGTYIWLVHGYNAAGYGPWVQPLSFTIGTQGSSTGPLPQTPATSSDPGAPGPATLISPSGAIAYAYPTFTWRALPDATQYYIFIEGPDGYIFEEIYAADFLTTGDICTLTLPDPLRQGAYIWLIHGYNANGFGPWISPFDFSIVD